MYNTQQLSLLSILHIYYHIDYIFSRRITSHTASFQKKLIKTHLTGISVVHLSISDAQRCSDTPHDHPNYT